MSSKLLLLFHKAPVLSGSTDKNRYLNKVLATVPGNLVAYWPLDEAGGPTAIDRSGQGNNATYGATTKAPTPGQTGIGDGRTSTLFDGGDYIDTFTAGLAADFNGREGTMMAWVKVSAAADWTDGANHYPMHLGASSNDKMFFAKLNAPNNTLDWRYHASGTVETVTQGGNSSLGWIHLACTWSRSAGVNGQFIPYKNGTALATQTTLGDYIGTLTTGYCIIGGATTTPAFGWKGYIAHVAVWNTPLTPAQVLNLATA